jgi:CRP-like cAMP-binding protein
MIAIMSGRSPLSPDEVLPGFPAALLSSARSLTLAPGHVLFRTGGRPRWMHYVREGEALMQRLSADGTVAVVQRATPGMFLAEASLTSARYHCDGVCASACMVLALPLAALRQAIDDDPAVRWAWIGQLGTQMRRDRLRLERLGLRTLPERLRHLLLTEGSGDGEYVLRGTRMQLAADLGVTHEALYRTLARLRAAGRLSVDGRTLRWRD